jgi:hypothetical protein
MSGRGSAPACMKVFSSRSASLIGPGCADWLEVHQDICPTWRRLALEIQPEMSSSKHRQGKYIGERKLHDTVHTCRPPAFAQTETGSIRPACV